MALKFVFLTQQTKFISFIAAPRALFQDYNLWRRPPAIAGMVHRESEEIRRASNHFTFANKAFISDSDLLKNIVIQREEFALKEATQRNASLHTPLKTRLAEDQCFFQRLKQFAWILPLIHTHFWASAAFILIQTFYAPLVSGANRAKYHSNILSNKAKFHAILSRNGLNFTNFCFQSIYRQL